jgi:cation transport ATPase
LNAQVESLLNRPPAQRLREYKYRCAQSIVFGIPVLFLHYFGQRLGGPESDRWVAVLCALLSGWVMYVGAAGMLLEGAILFSRRGFDWDLVFAIAAIAIYFGSLVSAGYTLMAGHSAVPGLFHISVLIIAVWTGFRWLQWARLARHSQGTH